MSTSDITAGVVCLAVPLVIMLAAIVALTWTRQEIKTILRNWIDRK